jgi:hypothetical protein
LFLHDLKHFNSRTLHAIVFQSAKQLSIRYTSGIDEDRKCSFSNTSRLAGGPHNVQFGACGAWMSSLGDIDWKVKVTGHIPAVPKFMLAVNSAFTKRGMCKIYFP